MTPDQIEQMAREEMDTETDWRGRVMFTSDSYGLTRLAQAVRAAALVEVMNACEERAAEMITTGIGAWALRNFADDIRALVQQAGGKQGGEKP